MPAAPLPTTADLAPRLPEPPCRHRGPRAVDVYGAEAEAATVGRILDALGCPARRGDPGAPAIGSHAEWGAPAIVIDGGGDQATIDLCTILSPTRPVILISDRTGFGFRLSAARAGVGALVARPVNPVELSEWLGHFGVGRAGDRATSVVVVDDEPLTSGLYAEILRSAGMVVEPVCRPTEAVEVIDACLPDLVLMDVRMPGVGGIELARVIRQQRRFVSLPILFLSSERDERRQIEARRLGGDDFIEKPVRPETLVSLVRMRADRARLIRSMIETDGLTGVLDHRRFKEHLSRELDRGRRSREVVSLVMIDIDRFKAVNDSRGHAAGDTVLRELATFLRSSLRGGDIVGRYGGEEFGVIMPGVRAGAAVLAIDRLRRAFRHRPVRFGGDSFEVTFSAGVACSLDHADPTRLIEAADRALYAAKEAGRNLVLAA